MLISVTITLWISVFLVRNNFASGDFECNGTSIKYDPDGLLALTNCTSILGSLTIMSLQDMNSNYAINKYQFPKLKEITGYLLLFSIKGLNSTGRLFPNLSVIRGQQLLQSYSLVIFELPHLTEIGFRSLISIQRGYVFIERCPSLCYQNTIDWEALTDEDEEDLGAGKGNVIQAAAPKCPTRESCRSCENGSCWSSYHCQKNKTSHYIKGSNPCNKLCLGGCSNHARADSCNVCLKWRSNGTCVDECPNDLLLYRETMRCITKEQCKNLYLIPFKGECRYRCPEKYSHFDPITKTLNENECFKCEVRCQQRCYGAEIRGVSNLEHFRGCTIVDGSLSIKLGLNIMDINAKLEETLGSIEVINGALRIHRSFSLTSLHFFRSLNKIYAENATLKTKDLNEYRNPYAIEITENDNLQTLFDRKGKPQFEITGGGLLIHSNSKLCISEIHSLQDDTNYDRSHDSIGYDTNGYDEICHATGIFATHDVRSHDSVRIYWNITDFGLNRRLIGYFVYYMEAPSQNITYFSGLDACSTKKYRSTSNDPSMPMIRTKSISEVWQSIFVPLDDITTEKGYFEMTLTALKQYTQYAYYVRTQLSLKHKDQMINVTQGQSELKYFSTLPDRPRPPIVRTKDKSNVTVTLEWIPSTPEQELVQKYFIDVYVLKDDVNEIDKRNYCRNPKEKPDDKKKDVVKAPEIICCRDQRAYLEFFQRDNNQSCGESDANCKLTYEFVLFHHHVEKALYDADLNRKPSERYQYKAEPHESPIHHTGTTDPIDRKSGSDHRHSNYYLHSHIIDNEQLTSIVVPNLKPFNLYAFYVYACNNISNCSDYYFHSDRTEPYRDADDVSIVRVLDDGRADAITLFIHQPTEPNGVTISYEIESYDINRDEELRKCITRKKMEDMNYTIRYENLLHGTHTFRVRSISLGEDGNYSNVIVIKIERSYHLYNWGTALAFFFIILFVIVMIAFRKFTSCQIRRGDDAVLLLPERTDSEPTVYEPRRINQLRRSATPTLPDAIPMTTFRSNVQFSDQSSNSDSASPNVSPIIVPVHNITLPSQPNTTVMSRPYVRQRLRRNDRSSYASGRDMEMPTGDSLLEDRGNQSDDTSVDEPSTGDILLGRPPQRRRNFSEDDFDYRPFFQ